jgi:ubiquinone/menaquinone biosynthesis C-methylase UbiE
MPTRDISAEFDQISLVYDETRDPLDAETVDALADRLRTERAAAVLEVGVGTGRVAKPLTDRGVLVTGVDASRGMLAKARAKGLPRLLRGSAYHLPFRDDAFDATLFVHVLHVLDDPVSAVHEATRVARLGAFALVHPHGSGSASEVPRENEPRDLIRQILVEQGYPIPPRSNPWKKEQEILTRFPPDSLRIVSEKDVTESLRSRIDRLAKRGHRGMLTIPPEVMQRAIDEARQRVGDQTRTFHRVEALAMWGPRPGDIGPGAPPA